jgi:cellobiose transport system substrate-binding protein
MPTYGKQEVSMVDPILESKHRRPPRISAFPLSGLLGCVVCIMALSLVLSACASSPANGKIHLTLWYWDRSIDDSLISMIGHQVFPDVQLQAIKISDYDNKVRTAMAGHYGVPDILGINSNIATYFPDEDQFADMRTLGADEVRSEYLPWKWNLGIAPDGKMIGFPMDTGPTALFYRADIFAQAGLPTDPQKVSARIKTWDDYLQMAAQLKQATHGKSFAVDNLYNLYTQLMAQSPRQYFDKATGQYIGDQSYMKQIWDETVKAAEMGVAANIPNTASTEENQAQSNGQIAAFVAAVWEKQILEEAAPNTAGKWRIAAAPTLSPGIAGNNGGSFLAISKECQYPQIAMQIIEWLQSPQNQLTAYKDIQLFPSAISALNDPSMYHSEAFFGGEDTTRYFAAAAKQVPLSYMSPDDGAANTAFSDQLNLVEFSGENPNQGWLAAQQEARREISAL